VHSRRAAAFADWLRALACPAKRGSDPALLALSLICAPFVQERILQCGGVEAAAAATAAAAAAAESRDATERSAGGSAATSGDGAGNGALAAPSVHSGEEHSAGLGTPQRLGAAMLFFGCRRRDQDYLYGGLLQGWADAGVLELHTAFSREKVAFRLFCLHDSLVEPPAWSFCRW
jgi:hypothetical protein